MTKNILFILTLLIVVSCDRVGKYKYLVSNGTKDTLSIKAIDRHNDLIMISIKPFSTTQISSESTGLLTARYAPNDSYKDTTIYWFKTFKVLVGQKEVKRNFTDRKMWAYYTPDLSTGIYQIVIKQNY